MLSRRELLASTAALSLLGMSQAQAWFPHGLIQPKAFQGPLFGGGYFMRFAFAADGSKKYVSYDSGNTGYKLNGTVWSNINSSDLAPSGFSNWGAGIGRINEFAVPPTNSQIVIGITGSKIVKSIDACASPWVDTGLSITSSVGHRGQGPICAFDPANENVAFFIKTNGSAFRTEDQFATLSAAAGAPSITSAQAGSVAFDPTSGTTTVNGKTVTKGVYLGFYSGSTAVYESLDGGATFNATTGGPANIIQWDMSLDGVLYATDSAAGTQNVWRYVTGTSSSGLSPGWTNLSMISGSYFNSVAADPLNVGHVAALMSSGNIVFSTNYGTASTYEGQPGAYRTATDTAWMQNWVTPNTGTAEQSMSNGSCKFDPTVSGRLWICEGIGVWQWDSTTPSSVVINSLSNGLGGIIVDQIRKMPSSLLLMSVQDRVAFTFADPAVPPVGDIGIAELNGGNAATVENGWGIDYAQDGSGFVVVMADGGLYKGTVSGGNLVMSLLTNTIGGQGMIACQSSSSIVVNVNGANFKYSTNGTTFSDSLFTSGVKISYGWGAFYGNYSGVVASDQDPATYYAMNRDGGQGARTISSIANPGSGYAANDTIYINGETNSGGGSQFTSIIQVLTVDGGGGILTAKVQESGETYAVPMNPVSQHTSSGAGTGATFNMTFASNAGLWKTTDGGANWTQVSSGLITANAVTMSTNATNAQLKKVKGGPYFLYGNGTTYNYGNFPCCLGVEAAGAVTWYPIKTITKGWQIASGPPAPGHSTPSLVYFGLCSTDPAPTVPGAFAIIDLDMTNPTMTPTSTRLFSAPNGVLDGPRCLECDPDTYPKFYWGYDATGFGRWAQA